MTKTRRTILRALALKATGLGLVLAAMSGAAFAGACPPPPKAVPEIDPSSILSAFTLFSGGLLILTDRRRAK